MVPVAKKGRPTAEQEELATRYQSCIRKLCDHEERVASLLASRKRRLTHKSSIHEDDQNVAAAEQSEAVSSIMQKPIQYRYADKPAYSVKGRRYTSNGGAQSMSRRLQCHAVDGHKTDLDIQNCCLTIIQQIIRKTMPDPALPQDLEEALDEVTNRRAEILQKLGEQPVEGKEIINTVLNGGTPPSHLREHDLIKKLQQISIYIRWMACNLLYSDYQLLKNVKHKTLPAATIMSQMWYAVEDMILQAWTEHALIGIPKHLSLHFDGIRISTDHIGDVAEYIRGCQDAIKAKTGFEVKISAKTHGSFMKLLKKRSAASKTTANVPAKLLDSGHCIPCGVWHTVPLSRPALVTAIQNAERADNIEAMKVKLRSYRSVASMCDLELLCCVGLPPSYVQSFVMHYEGDGSPHCVAVKIEKSSNAVTVIDGTEQYKLQQEISRDSYHGAVDRSTILYRTGSEIPEINPKARRLCYWTWWLAQRRAPSQKKIANRMNETTA